MNFIIILEEEDINTGTNGDNYQITTKEGLTILFQKEAIKELVKKYQLDIVNDGHLYNVKVKAKEAVDLLVKSAKS